MVAALYRRYRPESFAEMIGQSQVTEPLMTALRTGRIGHAYLFSGPRGCGKTTSARILARCLNCAEGPTDTPCGECPSCRELSRDGGGSLDVVEIDAASHGGVDDARDLRERAVFAPARDRFKIFIIDEAHMVTPGGFNALLKIVEEPPPHVKFVFATTEPDKVIGTIRSRTHHYPFRLIAPGTLIDYVQSLCDSEGVRVEPGVLPLVVRAGGGSVRDTLSILDQLIAGSEGDLVTAERAAGLLGFTHAELLDDVVAALGVHDSAAAFRATDRVVQTGQDPRRFVEDLLERLRDLIVVSATTVDGAAAVFRGVPQDQLARMFEQAQSFGAGELSRIADVVSGALDKMAGATAPRLQLELMIARVLVAQQNAPQTAAAPQRAAASGGGPAQSGGGRLGVAQGGAAAGGAQVGAAGAAGAAAARSEQGGSPTPGAGGQHQPVQQTSRPDPLAAVAAARGAAAGGSEEARPNAAETAASIREFLRGDPAGAEPAGAVTADPTAAETGGAGTADPTAAEAAGTGPADPASSAGPGQSADPVEADSAAPVAPASTAQSAAPTADDSSSRASSPAAHPNAGAAGFGRPISEVLSAAQLEGIGRDTAFQASPAPAEQRPAPQTPVDAAESRSGGPDEQPQAQRPVQPAAAPGGADSQAPRDLSQTGASGAAETGADEAGEAEPAASGGFDDLVELWPELLEEILHADRDAWNAVRVVTPLGLDGEVLTVGLASQSDLAAFKTVGANPLRETINAAIGINVKYVPKRIAPGTGARESGPQGESSQSGPQREPDAEEPHRAGASGAPNGLSSDDPVARAAARLSGLGPALAAPAWADPPPAPPAEPAAAPAEPAVAPVEPSPAPAQAPAPASASASASASAEDTGSASAVDRGFDGRGTVDPGSAEQGSAEAGPAEAGSAEPGPVAPAPTGSGPDESDADGSGGGEPGPAARSDSGAAIPHPARQPDDDYIPASYDPDGDPYAGMASDPYADGGGAPDAIGVGHVASAAKPAAIPEPAVETASKAPASAPDPSSDTDSSAAKRTAPTFTRYGEAVVREVLGARFVEERPLPPRAP
ncbi:DNA polymerase III subunit gamma and tau [Leucobacter tenebrionis]|uniref:DNA polymerase III subunit gamma and tau n=1 Tax=Leucobacter tenebrionis TaxID=2873270 RepID=UPI0021053FBA|nr:DNA polymerase III subunit gamma and tau [Leucobacter tenebrionis]